MISSNPFGLEFHHFGLAVRKPQKAIHFLRDLDYQIGPETYDELQNVNLRMGEHSSMPDIELIYPTDSPGPLDEWLTDYAQIIYHLCYVSENVEQTIDKLRQEHRIITISPPKPAILFNFQNVSFYQIHGFGLVEILECTA
ncbi:VOC family protein [Acaryochloris marina]|uniref:VOC family protein n=1 Tax=Acaryochloris marina TaxID=155978 RepID=UPI001BB0AC5B|nr:VOC family protein [Acaryochloris marina]QUY43028.1 VOC family protein [Acaryochloris marina S15]